MDVLAKLKSTVNQYLPGNPLSKDYDIASQHTASFGPGLLWKVYKATSYGPAKQEASVCLFEKKLLDQFSSKADRDFILDVIRKGVQQLTKLRHPRILAVYHQLEETTSALAFATEPILCSLANKLRYPSDPTIPEEAVENWLRTPLHEIDIKFGFVQICEGLSFLHNDAKIVHGNLCPENVILTTSGDWKLSGFEFAIVATQASAGVQAPTWSKFNWQNNIPSIAQPSLGYFAPEYRRNSNAAVSPAADMFSIGCLFHTVNNGGRPMLDPADRNSNGFAKWEDWIDRVVRNARWENALRVPADVSKHVTMLLSADPSIRPDADQVIKLPFFQDVAVQTLQYLDTLVQRDLIQRSQFFRGLPKVVDKLPKHVNVNRVLPPLFREFSNPDMVPFLLPPILTIAEMCTPEEYVKHVFPGLSPAFKLVQPVQIPLILLQHMNLLLQKTNPNDVRNYVLPMAYVALETGNETVQELCLSTLPTVSSLIDYGTLKSAIVPRIKKLALETAQMAIKVKCMVCLAKLLECMDKWFVLDHVLPFLPQVKTSEPAVIMTILGIYKVALTDRKLGITKEALVAHCLPFLLHLSLETSINLEQYEALMDLVRQMIEQVQMEQRTKLQQLALLRDQHATLTSSMDDVAKPAGLGSPAASVRSSASTNNLVATGHLLPSSMVSSSSSGDIKTGEDYSAKLSMEDKERLAVAQRQQNRLRNEPAPTPVPVSNLASNSGSNNSNRQNNNGPMGPPRSQQSSNSAGPLKVGKPKDLTSTLIERELAQMAVQIPPSSSSSSMASPFGQTNSSTPLSTPGSLGSWSGSAGYGFGGSTMAPSSSFASPQQPQQFTPSFPSLQQSSSTTNGGLHHGAPSSFPSSMNSGYGGSNSKPSFGAFPPPPVSGSTVSSTTANNNQQKGNADLLDFLG